MRDCLVVMLCAIDAVGVPMGAFVVGRFANVHDLDFEVQSFTGQRVVGVDKHLLCPNLGDPESEVTTVGTLGKDRHTWLNLEIVGKRGTLNRLGTWTCDLTVPVGWRNSHFEVISCGTARELAFEAEHNITRPLKARQRLPALRAVEHVTSVIAQRVVENNNLSIGDGDLGISQKSSPSSTSRRLRATRRLD